MDIRPIRTDADHEAALAEIERLWGADPDTEDGARLDVLLALAERYEEEHFQIPEADPVDVIKFVMEQNGYSQKDLAEVLGSKSRASEILNRQRELSLDHIKKLNRVWHIPAELLLGQFAAA